MSTCDCDFEQNMDTPEHIAILKGKNYIVNTHMQYNICKINGIDIYKIIVFRQQNNKTCGFHALSNAIHLNNLFSVMGSNIFPNDAEQIILHNNKKIYWKSIDPDNIDPDYILDLIHGQKIIDTDYYFVSMTHNNKLIWFPYSIYEYGILIMQPIYFKKNILPQLENFNKNSDDYLIMIIGQKEHYVTVCFYKLNNILECVLCDSRNRSINNIKSDSDLNLFIDIFKEKKSFNIYWANIVYKDTINAI